MQVDVLIFYEHLVRDLETSLLLEAVLASLGLTVEVKSLPYQFWETQMSLNPRLVITPWASRRLLHLRNPDGRLPLILDLHQEQIGIESEVALKSPREPFNHFSHAAWGEVFRGGLVASYVNSENVFVTGYPRLDFYRPELKGLSFSKDELGRRFNLDKEKKWVLFVSSFSGADSSSVDNRRQKKHGFSKVEERSKDAEEQRRMTIKLLADLSLQYQEFQYIYRPHPSESSGVSRFFEKTGVRVIRELDIRHWFLVSDLGLIWNSTSCIEALCAKIPFFKLRVQELDPKMEIISLRNVPVLDAKNIVSVFDKFKKMDRISFFKHLSKSYDLFREDMKGFYADDKFALLETAAVTAELLESGIEQKGIFKNFEYQNVLVRFEKMRIRIRNWAIRKKILPLISKNYEIKENDLPSIEREKAFRGMIDRNVDIDEIIKMHGKPAKIFKSRNRCSSLGMK